MVRHRALLVSLAVSAAWHVLFFGGLHITVRLPIFHQGKPVVVMFSALPQRSEAGSPQLARNNTNLKSLLAAGGGPLGLQGTSLFDLRSGEGSSLSVPGLSISHDPEMIKQVAPLRDVVDESFRLAKLEDGSLLGESSQAGSSVPSGDSPLELKSILDALQDATGATDSDDELISLTMPELDWPAKLYDRQLFFSPDILEPRALDPLQPGETFDDSLLASSEGGTDQKEQHGDDSFDALHNWSALSGLANLVLVPSGL